MNFSVFFYSTFFCLSPEFIRTGARKETKKSHRCIKNPCFLLFLFLLPASRPKTCRDRRQKEAKKRAFAIRMKLRFWRTTAAVNTGAQADPSFPSPLFLRIALSSRLQCQRPGGWASVPELVEGPKPPTMAGLMRQCRRSLNRTGSVFGYRLIIKKRDMLSHGSGEIYMISKN